MDLPPIKLIESDQIPPDEMLIIAGPLDFELEWPKDAGPLIRLRVPESHRVFRVTGLDVESPA